MKNLLLGAAAITLATSAFATDIKLTTISTTFNNPIGIDYHEPTDSVLMSVNYPSGSPNNFVRVKADGTQVGFSSVSGLTDELKVATARSGSVFATGTAFTGNGIDGQIIKISPDGSTVINPWVDLPGSGNGLIRGSMYVDRTGVWGGDLLVVTTSGEAWRVNAAGTPTMVASVGTHLEGLISVPNDAAKYGPLAGKMIAGAENQGLMYVFSPDGTFTTKNVGVNIEDIDMINKNENFYGVNYGSGRLLGAASSEFDAIAGDILLTQEFGGGPSGLFDLHWDGTSLVASPLGLAAGSQTPSQWEHVTFAPAGIVEIPHSPVPDAGSTLGLSAVAMLGLATARRFIRPVA